MARWARALRSVDGLHAGHALTVIAALLLAGLPLIVTGERAGLDVGEARGAFEALGAAMVAFAAAVLAIPENAAVRPARNAFFAGLVVLAVSNLVAATHVLLATDASEVGFWPWVSARYVTAALFALAASGRAPRSLIRHTSGGLVVWGAVATVATLALGHAPAGWFAGAVPYGPLAAVPAVLIALPAAVFGVAAWLAGRLYRRTTAVEYAWLSLAFTAQVGSQVHQILYPAFLGPWLTTADLLRLASFLLLAGGAVAQLRRLYLERSEAVTRHEEDLRLHEALVERWRAFAEREADFRTIVAHELATPVATINAFAHVVTARVADDPALQRAVDGIRSETRRLSELTRRMDELRQLGTDAFVCELRAVNAADLVDGAATFVEAVGSGHRLETTVEPARVQADPVRFGQALRNLLANATRYSPAGSTVRLTGRVQGPRYAVSIEDRGPGIDRDERARLLRAYERGAGTATTPGQGVGLFVAERIAAAHGGVLTLEDAPGGGTRAVLHLGLAG